MLADRNYFLTTFLTELYTCGTFFFFFFLPVICHYNCWFLPYLQYPSKVISLGHLSLFLAVVVQKMLFGPPHAVWLAMTSEATRLFSPVEFEMFKPEKSYGKWCLLKAAENRNNK